MRKNNDILEILESLEKKLVLTNPELIDNLDKTYNPTFSPTNFIWHTLVFTTMVTFVIKTFSIREEMVMERGFLEFDLSWLSETGRSQCMALNFIVISVFFLLVAYSGKSACKEWNVDANDLKEIKQYLEIIDLKDYEIKNILLKNIRELKHILEQRDISEEEKQIILEFLEEIHKWL